MRDEILSLARWRAAHDGLEGHAVHPYTAELVPAMSLVDALLDQLHVGLQAAGDLRHVADTAAVLRRDGCGARRQRRVYERRHPFTDGVRHLADTTERQHA
ncbi:hypothetical protein ACOBQB_00590 [Streptomyces sp. G5(2025)]|uniref:hypothetical protein n=1 Tax=Streptomyces sp. G5(2025) TaxID=3406628 RepID=UPI003C1DB59F